jgi:4-oxalomesaconate tautomerase
MACPCSLGLKAKLETVHPATGKLMGLGDVAQKVVPKITLLAAPQQGALATRSFIPHACHTSTGVLGAVSVAMACVLPGTVAERELPQCRPGNDILVSIEHPTGEFTVHLETDRTSSSLVVRRAGLIRTARKLFDDEVFGKE